MLIEDKFIIRAPLPRIWDFFMDPAGVSTCLPGCEEAKAIDEKNFQGVVKIKVGPISVKFKVVATIIEIDPPFYLTSIIKGEDIWKAGFFQSDNIVNFKEVSLDETEVSFKSEVNIVGRLATFGDRIIRAKARQFKEDFVSSLKGKLEVGFPGNPGREKEDQGEEK